MEKKKETTIQGLGFRVPDLCNKVQGGGLAVRVYLNLKLGRIIAQNSS